MIKNALSVLPTRPVLYIVPVAVTLLMSFYYWSLYTECANDAQFRASFIQQLESMDSTTRFRLADITNFGWDKVRIVSNFKPKRKIVDCPFGWGWSAAERKSLIVSDLLSALIFANKDSIVEYIDIRSDQIAFEDINTSLSPDTAIFNIIKSQSDAGTITLSLYK